jgi:hypothetical protein
MLLVVFLVMRQDMPAAASCRCSPLFAYTGFRVVPSANRIMLNVGYMRERIRGSATWTTDMRKLRAAGGRSLRARSAADADRRCRASTCRSATKAGRRWRWTTFRS